MNENDHRQGPLSDARDVFISALKTHEHFVYKLGYEAGFQAGWEAVVQRLASQKPDLSLAPGHEDPEEAVPHQEMVGPARDTLMTIITHTPGLERHEIIETARKAANLSDRCLRMALQALRDAGVLRVEGGRWYPVLKDETTAKEPKPRRITASDFDE
jgi:hypothetical protein